MPAAPASVIWRKAGAISILAIDGHRLHLLLRSLQTFRPAEQAISDSKKVENVMGVPMGTETRSRDCLSAAGEQATPPPGRVTVDTGSEGLTAVCQPPLQHLRATPSPCRTSRGIPHL